MSSKTKDNPPPIVRDKFGNIIEVSPNQRITYVHSSHFASSGSPVSTTDNINDISEDNTVSTNNDYKVNRRKVNKTVLKK